MLIVTLNPNFVKFDSITRIWYNLPMENEIFSLNVFDVAILRKTLSQEDLWRTINDTSFFDLRKNAELTLKKGRTTYTINDVYELLPQYDKDVEIAAELRNTIANEEVKNKCNSFKDKFVFIEETPLSGEQLIQILKQCGYKYPKVYTSADLGCSKTDGKLFKEVERITGAKIKAHYGTNYRLDVLQPKILGIPGVLNIPLYKQNVCIPSISVKNLNYFMVQGYAKESANWRIRHYKLFARMSLLFILSFILWVREKTYKTNKVVCFKGEEMSFACSIYRDLYSAEAVHTDNFKEGEGFQIVTLSNNDNSDYLSVLGSDSARSFSASSWVSEAILKLIFCPDTRIRRGRFRKLKDTSERAPIACINYLIMSEYRKLLEEVKTFKIPYEDGLEILKFLHKGNSAELRTFYLIYLFEDDPEKRSIINYDRDAIKSGYLQQFYNNSELKDVFIQMLREDNELYSLEDYLTKKELNTDLF